MLKLTRWTILVAGDLSMKLDTMHKHSKIFFVSYTNHYDGSINDIKCKDHIMRAIIAVISDLSTDMRVKKHAELLSSMGFTVTLIGRHCGRSLPLSFPNVTVSMIRVPFTKGPMMYISFNMTLMFRLFLLKKPDLYVANDLDTLVPCHIVSWLFRRPLVYDSHEYYTGQYSLTERDFKRSLWTKVERRLLPKVRYMITVSESIADLYRQEYGCDPVVIRNLPLPASDILPHKRSDLGAGADDLLVVFQDGSGDNPGRGADELLEAMTLVENVRLVIIGTGKRIEEARQQVQKQRLDSKVIFLDRMTWEEMIRFIKCCDAGLSIDADTCINQRLSLPNKLFDTIGAGVPVITSPLPEVSAVVSRYRCGLVLDEMTPRAIAGALSVLRDDRQLLSVLKDNARAASEELTWEKEQTKERELFQSVIIENNIK